MPGKTVHRKIVPSQRIGCPTLPYRITPEQLQLAHNVLHRNTNSVRKKRRRAVNHTLLGLTGWRMENEEATERVMLTAIRPASVVID